MTDNQVSQDITKNKRWPITISLRTKILLGNLLIVLIMVAAMGYFVFYRSQAANEFLVNQFDISITREIENRLTAIVSDEANDISNFFSSKKNVIDTFRTATGAILSDDDSINLEETSWNANLALKQLPSGSWDNSNEELGSIFLPAKTQIRDDLAQELVALKRLDFFVHGFMDNNPDIIAVYFGGISGETVYYPNVDLAAIVPPDFNITKRPWYLNAIANSQTEGKAVWSIPYQDAALNGLVITSSAPVYDKLGTFRGVVGLDLKLATITERISSLAIGKTGYGFLIDSDGRVIAMPSEGLQDFNLTEEEIQSGNFENLSLIKRVPLDVFEVIAKMTSGQSGIGLVKLNGSNRYIAYKPVSIIGYSLGVVVSEDELLEDFVETNKTLETETHQTIFNAAGVIFILLSLAALASFGMGNSITAPLEKLTNTAKRVAAGDLDATAEVTSGDEIGILGNTLNSMSASAKNLITNLEERVVERTHLIEKRISQIQAAAEIGKAVAAQRDLEELLDLTTQLISSRFGFYHVGVFLLDPGSEYAILMAANSSGGKKMLERKHKLRVGAEGIVGTVAGTGEARIALDVGEDAIYFDNPDLPHTRSEMALPLIAGSEVQGVLDIQSLEANAFSADDIPTLQIMADQLAIAMQNTRMLRDTQEALFAARKATGELSQHGWQTLLENVGTTGYVGLTHGEIIHAAGNLDDTTSQILKAGKYVISQDKHTISMPIITRGQTIGVMKLTKPDYTEPWTSEEISDVESLSDQLSSTLDSARLYKEAQQRAAREQTIGEITTSITSAAEIDDILRKTVTQLGMALEDTDITLRINNQWA